MHDQQYSSEVSLSHTNFDDVVHVALDPEGDGRIFNSYPKKEVATKGELHRGL